MGIRVICRAGCSIRNKAVAFVKAVEFAAILYKLS